MEVNEVLLEILSEVKKLSSEQAAINAKLEGCIKMTDRQDEDIRELQKMVTDVHRHGLILKGSLWLYGVVFVGLLGKFFSANIHQ